jgi:hypothetical protein
MTISSFKISKAFKNSYSSSIVIINIGWESIICIYISNKISTGGGRSENCTNFVICSSFGSLIHYSKSCKIYDGTLWTMMVYFVPPHLLHVELVLCLENYHRLWILLIQQALAPIVFLTH